MEHAAAQEFPTLAEYLGSHGYATAGFVANNLFCSYDTGLDRGFTHYEDYELGPLAAVRTASWSTSSSKVFFDFASNPASFDSGPLRPSRRPPGLGPRKIGSAPVRSIGNSLIGYPTAQAPPSLLRVPQLLRCPRTVCTFPRTPCTTSACGRGRIADAKILDGWNDREEARIALLPSNLARIAYDNCLVYLDEQLGELFEELQRAARLDRTLES